MKLERYIEKCNKIISNEGIIVFCKKAFKYTAAKTFRVNRMIIYELNIINPVKSIVPSIDLNFIMASEKDIDSMDEDQYGYDEKAKIYSKEGLSRGDVCVLAYHEDRIVGYISYMKDRMELSEGNFIEISARMSYLYKGFVLEEFRGNRILGALINYQIQMLKRIGKKFLVYTVSTKNISSIKATERIGFKRVGSIIQVRLLGLKYDYISRKDLGYLQGVW